MPCVDRVNALIFVLLLTASASLWADEAAEKESGIGSPEQTVLLMAVPRGECSVMVGRFMVSSEDRPWWSSIWSEPNWDIEDKEITRLRKEIEAAPYFGPGVVYECRAKWVVHGENTLSGLRTLHVTSSPKRLPVKGDSWRQARITGDKSDWQPSLWDGNLLANGGFLWLLEKGKAVAELAGEYERLTAELKKAKVDSRATALALAAKDSEVFKPEHATTLVLDRAVVEQRGFIKRGDLFWAIAYEVEAPEGNGMAWTEVYINARTAMAVSSMNATPRSLAKHLDPSADAKPSE